MHTWQRIRRRAALPAVLAGALALSACGSDDDGGNGGGDGNGGGQGGDSAAAAPATVTDPLVATYDGGLYVLDGETLEVVEDIPLEGFNRINPAGDDRHVLVSTSTGFQVLDAGAAELTDAQFEGPEPGHVVLHADRTVLFADGTGEVTSFDPHDLGDGLPETESYTTEEPHHGVAIEMESGELLVTLGTPEERSGVAVLDEAREEIDRNEECPGVHGEATAAGDVAVFGCEDGALVYRDGELTKIDSPTDYGRMGNLAGSPESPVVLGDYKQDPDAELERPEEIALIDTESASLDRVDLGTSYTFRSLARGPHGEAMVLGTDGAIHVIDPEAGEVVDTFPVLEEEWEEPLEWQQPRPTLFVRDHTAYVTDPENRTVYAVDTHSGETLAEAELPEAPNEFTGVIAGH